MRAFASGLIILALAVVFLAWDDSELPRQLQAVPGTLLSGVGAARTLPTAPRAPAIGGRRLEDRRPGIVTFDPTRVESAAKPGARLDDRAMGSTPKLAKPIVQGTATRVRELAPGSKPRSEAIAPVAGPDESDESEDPIEPLTRLYLAYFNRAPDSEGLNYYIDERDRGTPLDSIAEEFAGSLEFQMRYGSVDNATFVDRVYQNVAGGPADAAERAHWVGQLDSGNMTRGEVMLAFSEGTDFRALTGNEVFVTMAYAETLNRAPDQAEFVRWVSFLDDGNPRGALIEWLLASRRTKQGFSPGGT